MPPRIVGNQLSSYLHVFDPVFSSLDIVFFCENWHC